MKILKLFLLLASISLLCACASIIESSVCHSTRPLSAHLSKQGLLATVILERKLNQLDDEVILLGRKGQNLDKYDILFSHTALAIKDSNTGKWQLYHALNECAGKNSGLYQEGLAFFFMTELHSYDVGIVLLDDDIQRQIKSLITKNPNFLKSQHHTHYNAVAYPYDPQSQNCNGWTLELISAVISEQLEDDRMKIQQWIKNNNYQQTRLSVGKFKRFIADTFLANVSSKGQAPALLNNNEIWFNTGDSVMQFFIPYSKNANQFCDKIEKDICVLITTD